MIQNKTSVTAAASLQHPSSPGKHVGATSNTMKVLDYVARHKPGASATEIARATGINPSTCFNIARTLVAMAYLEFSPESRKYATGPALRSLALQLNQKSRDVEALRPAMQRLANEYQLTVTFWHRCAPATMELLMVAESNSPMRIQMPLGQRLPILLGGMGRIMALQAGLSDEQRESIFNSVHWGRPLTFNNFMTQAKLARRVGYGMDRGFTHRSVTAVAVPASMDGDAVQDVFSATMFIDQHDEAEIEKLVAELKKLAKLYVAMEKDASA